MEKNKTASQIRSEIKRLSDAIVTERINLARHYDRTTNQVQQWESSITQLKKDLIKATY